MADDRSTTGPGAAEDVHDDDELADVLAAELERYATGSVPLAPATRPEAGPAQPARPPAEPMQPLAVPRVDEPPLRRPRVRDESPFADRAAEIDRVVRATTSESSLPGDTFRRVERPVGRRTATGPVLGAVPAPNTEDLPVVRRSGFRPPPTASELSDVPPAEPLDRVLPTGPVTLPEATASLLDAMITDSTPTRPARHAAPPTRPQPEVAPAQEAFAVRAAPETPPAHAAFQTLAAPGPAPEGTRAPAAPETPATRAAFRAAPAQEAAPASPLPPEAFAAPAEPVAAEPRPSAGLPDGLYDDWERSLRSIGRPRDPWDQDDEIIPTGGDPELQTMALPILPNGVRRPTSTAGTQPVHEVPPAEPPHRGAHALPVAPESVEEAAPPRRRSGRRRAPVADPDPEPHRAASDPDDPLPVAVPASVADQHDADAEGIDEVAVDYPVVSAATTGAIDLPTVAQRPRTAPVIIERVRTALLQLPTVPPSPTGSGAAAVVGRWFGAFASPLALLLGFALVGAGAGPAAAVAVLAGALLAVPAVARSAAWSATAAQDGDLQEAAVLGAAPGRVVAVVLLLARVAATSVVLLLAGTTAGAWADRTGAFGLSGSTASLVGCTVVGLLALVVAALPTRATAVLVLLSAVVGTIGTLLIALLLAPTGTSPAPTTASGVVAAVVAGFVGVGLVLVLCAADVARWRTDLARPASSAVGAVVAGACGAALVAGGTLLASRLGSAGDPADEFASALSDASASVLAGPLLVVLLVAAVTLPALLIRSSGAAAARLLGVGRPVRLGAVAAALLALAGALGVLAAGSDPIAVALAAAAVLGIPVAAWAGVLSVPPARARGRIAALGMLVATVVGLLLADGVVPGGTSPLLDVLGVPASAGLRGGPAVGVAVALLLGVLSGVAGRAGAAAPVRSASAPADTVEG